MSLSINFKSVARVTLLTPVMCAAIPYFILAVDLATDKIDAMWDDAKVAIAERAQNETKKLETEAMKNGAPPPWAIRPF